MSWRHKESYETKPALSNLAGKHERTEAGAEVIGALVSMPRRIFSPTPCIETLAFVGDAQLQLTLAEVRALRHAAMDRADWRAHCRERRMARRRSRHLKNRSRPFGAQR
jgi:hypothetical protein